jgi:hypothetical protein
MEIVLILIGIAFYFLPSIIGFSKSNFVSIFMLNFLLGWSVIGWVVALIWALSNDAPAPMIINNKSASQADEITKIKKLYDDGVINAVEYEEMKSKALS